MKIKYVSFAAIAVCAALFGAPGVLQAIDLPSPVCVTVVNPGPAGAVPSYFDLTLQLPGGPAVFDGWCADTEAEIHVPVTYTANVLGLNDALVPTLVEHPENLPNVLWVLNQRFQVGGVYTYGDVQYAIWMLLEGPGNVPNYSSGEAGLGTYSQARAQQIYADALANGNGFTPQCGQVTAVFLNLIAVGCQPPTPATGLQLILMEVPADCQAPGTGTPGYWMNHPDAWPVDTILVGGNLCGTTYTKADAIALMKAPVKKDMRLAMFPQLVSAKLNVLIGNPSSCIDATIIAADEWWCQYGKPLPGGTPVPASSPAWKIGGPLATMLDAYNNGLLCAPHRD